MNDFCKTVVNLVETITATVGKQLMADFGQVQAAEKADGSLITRSDKWADDTIRNAIATTFPHHGILSEEGETIFPATEWCWVIDPLDGTTNFARGIPIWGICIALLYRGTPVFGYVALPPINQNFHGFWDGNLGHSPLEVANGAFLNNHPIHTSNDAPSGNQFFSFCSRSIPKVKHPFPCKIRMLGVASYNFLTVATGWTLGGVEATPKIWDIAAVWVILQAAGGSWAFLNSEQIFPLVSHQDYGQKSLPSLVTSRQELLSFFQPFLNL